MLGIRINELNDDKLVSENFVCALVREAMVTNSNVEELDVRKAVEVGALSWEMMVNQGKEAFVEKMKAVDVLDESQCNELFDKMNGLRPTELQGKRRDYVLTVIRRFYEKWIMKCTYCICECHCTTRLLQCPYSYSFFVRVIPSVSPEDVGGKEILNNIKRDITEIVKDIVNPNMMCYCQHLLSEYNSESAQSQDHCRLCQKSLDNKRYDCDNESCIYKRISGLQFWICPSCYEQNAYSSINYTEDGWKEIFSSKLRSSIGGMS